VIHLQGQVVALSSVHPATPHLLGLLDRYAALPLSDEYGACNDKQECCYQEQYFGRPYAANRSVDGQVNILQESSNGPGHSGDDSGHDDQANAVAYAVLIYLLAEPHKEYGPGGHAYDPHKQGLSLHANIRQTLAPEQLHVHY
jgi:hypothetical protein